MTLTPIHLFAQFWYHTQHIGKLGFLEYIIVTPSQHRVHHAINPIYIDKNLAAIFCVWDRIFGTFQEELENEPPVYGTLKPALSWNPIWINFQHLYLLARDAYHTQKWQDKLRIWFMPTGWRPKDVSILFPIVSREINTRKKYKPTYNFNWKVIAVIHFAAITIMLFFLLSKFSDLSFGIQINFSLLIFFSIFGFTALMDYHSWAPTFEIFRGIVSLLFIMLFQSQFSQITSPFILSFLVCYFLFTVLVGVLSRIKEPNRKLVLP